jgi:medium-chain acyl-[acyl-carrier-protein] hydrolase
MHGLPDGEFVAELANLKGTPEGVLADQELMDLLLPVLRADFAVCETYVYQPGEPVDCPISVFGGLNDEELSQEDFAAWKEQTRDAFSLKMLPGGHFFVQSAREHVLPAMRETVREYLQRGAAGGEPLPGSLS